MTKCPKCKFYNICKGRLNETVENCVRFKSTEQTNEEWFDTLSTEEKAETIANATYYSAMMGLEITALPKEDEVRKWKMWLKQPHTIKE